MVQVYLTGGVKLSTSPTGTMSLFIMYVSS